MIIYSCNVWKMNAAGMFIHVMRFKYWKLAELIKSRVAKIKAKRKKNHGCKKKKVLARIVKAKKMLRPLEQQQ